MVLLPNSKHLRKFLKFQVLAIINITSLSIGFIVFWILAFRGFGVYSVIGYITESTLNSFLIVVFGLKNSKNQN